MTGTTRAGDIMTANPKYVTPQSNLVDAARVMKEENVGIVPVVEEGSRKLVGLVTDRDIAIRVVAEGRDSNNTSVANIMSTDIKACRPEDSVDEVMNLMGKEQVRRVPIVDDRGSLVGIIAQADIVLETTDDQRSDKVVEQISKPSGKHAQ